MQTITLTFQPQFKNPDAGTPAKFRLGRCYELSGRLATANPGVAGLRLVHGSIEGAGKPRLGHAWVELTPELVWEPFTNRIWPRDAFDRFFSARVDATYAVGTVDRLTVEHGHWGPWI